MSPEEQNKAQGKLGGKVLVPWGERETPGHGSKRLSVTSRWEPPAPAATLQCVFNSVQFFATLWTVAHQAPLSMGFSRQEYWSGLPCLFSRRSFQSRDRTNVSYISCIAGRFLTTEAFRKTGCRMGFSSVTQSCLTLCNPRDCSIPGFPVPQQLLELSPTLVHHIGDAIQPFHPHPLFILPAFNLSQHQGFFQ